MHPIDRATWLDLADAHLAVRDTIFFRRADWARGRNCRGQG